MSTGFWLTKLRKAAIVKRSESSLLTGNDALR